MRITYYPHGNLFNYCEHSWVFEKSRETRGFKRMGKLNDSKIVGDRASEPDINWKYRLGSDHHIIFIGRPDSLSDLPIKTQRVAKL